MKIDSTLNISDFNVKLLDNKADQLSISRNCLIIKLLLQYAEKQKNKLIQERRIVYQKKKEGNVWLKKHIWLEPKFYEKCLDLRKFHKCSVSLILAIAIDLYLDEIDNNTDNYEYYYKFIIINNGKYPIFIVMWGRIEKKESIIFKQLN